MAVEHDPLDVMEKQLREADASKKRYAATPASDMDGEWAASEVKDTILPLLTDFMLLTFNLVATMQEYIEREVQPLVIAEAERDQDPSQLDPDDAQAFASLIADYQRTLQEGLAALETPKTEAQAEARKLVEEKITECQDALERIEDITLEIDDDEEEDDDDEGAEVVSLAGKADGEQPEPGAAEDGEATEPPPPPGPEK